MNKKIVAPRKIKNSVKSKSVKRVSGNKKNKTHWMMAKIDTHFAFAIIFLLAGGLAIYVCIDFCAEDIDSYKDNLIVARAVKPKNKVVATENNCTDHYYEGSAEVRGWKADMDTNGEIVMQIDPEDIKKLPEVDKNFDQGTLNLVDATEEVRAGLEKSSANDPMPIIIQGYGVTCNSNLPVASLKSVAEVFKRS